MRRTDNSSLSAAPERAVLDGAAPAGAGAGWSVVLGSRSTDDESTLAGGVAVVATVEVVVEAGRGDDSVGEEQATMAARRADKMKRTVAHHGEPTVAIRTDVPPGTPRAWSPP